MKRVKKLKTTPGPWRINQSPTNIASWIENDKGITIGVIYRQQDAEFIVRAKNGQKREKKTLLKETQTGVDKNIC